MCVCPCVCSDYNIEWAEQWNFKLSFFKTGEQCEIPNSRIVSDSCHHISGNSVYCLFLVTWVSNVVWGELSLSRFFEILVELANLPNLSAIFVDAILVLSMALVVWLQWSGHSSSLVSLLGHACIMQMLVISRVSEQSSHNRIMIIGFPG